jgi:protein SCO1/2
MPVSYLKRQFPLQRFPARGPLGVALSLLLFCFATAPPARGQQTHTHEHHAHQHRAERQPSPTRKGGRIESGRVSLEIPDVRLLDQEGRGVRFYSDLIKDKVVVVNFFFTSCSYVCPMQGQALAKLKPRLGERLGREVFFISVSKDPEVDTVQHLKVWGKEFGAGPGWTLVTGEQEPVGELIRRLTGQGLGQDMHTPLLLIGNDRTGVWVEADGLEPSEELVAIIDRVAGKHARATPDAAGGN